MKFLNGLELAEFIKERQAHQVRGLRQAQLVQPKLVIILTTDNPLINADVQLKQQYGEDILVDIEVHHMKQSETAEALTRLNNDPSVHAIVVQLPLEDPSQTDELVNLVAPAKDVDALGEQAIYDPAAPLAILWLLAGYNIELSGKQVLLIGHDRLVGTPLERMLQASGIVAQIADHETSDLTAQALQADVIITATGSPAILQPDMIKHGAVVVDAGMASEGGKTVGDVAPKIYERDDLTITPLEGGVSSLVVCALFENVIRAANASITANE